MKHQAIGQEGNPSAVFLDEVSGQGIALLGKRYVPLETGQGREAQRGLPGLDHQGAVGLGCFTLGAGGDLKRQGVDAIAMEAPGRFNLGPTRLGADGEYLAFNDAGGLFFQLLRALGRQGRLQRQPLKEGPQHGHQPAPWVEMGVVGFHSFESFFIG